MDVTITTRHCSVPESIRNQTVSRLGRTLRLNPAALGATANFSAEGASRRIEIRVPLKGAPPLIGHGEGATFRTALDRAVARIARQLKRRNDRHRNRRAAPALADTVTVA